MTVQACPWVPTSDESMQQFAKPAGHCPLAVEHHRPEAHVPPLPHASYRPGGTSSFTQQLLFGIRQIGIPWNVPEVQVMPSPQEPPDAHGMPSAP